MTLLPRRPPHQPGDMKRRKWQHVPEELAGKEVTEDELNRLFPADELHGEIGILEFIARKSSFEVGYAIYGQKSRLGSPLDKPLAYLCGECKKIMMGPPEVEDDNSIKDGVPLSGRLGYDVRCKGCNSCLESVTLARSAI